MKMSDIRFKGLFILFGALLTGCVSRQPKALVVMLDGCRADALVSAPTPNIDKLRSGTWQPGYNGAYTDFAQTVSDARPSSAANHVAIATGASAEKTGVFENRDLAKRVEKCREWPTWLKRVADETGAKALFTYSWNADANIGPDPKVEFVFGTDAANGERLPKSLAAPDAPDATLYFIDLPDHAGHADGFYPAGPTYVPAIATCDKYVGACLDAVASRPTFKDEDWLVVVTADHGGQAHTHGLWGGHCTTVPFVVAGRNTPQGRLAGLVCDRDACALALRHFGLDAGKLNLDARVPEKTLPVEKPRDLKDGLACSGRRSAPGGVRLEGSEKFAFENGNNFAVTLWAQLPETQDGDPLIFGNKDWNRGYHPGVALSAAKLMDGVETPGVVLNAGPDDSHARTDQGPFKIQPGQWTFYGVTLTPDGVLVVCQGTPDGHFHWIAKPTPGLKLTTGLPFYIGQDGTGRYGKKLNGDVKDFSLWTRSLSLEEIRAIYEKGPSDQ